MSLDLSILTKNKISDKTMQAIKRLLNEAGYAEDDFGFTGSKNNLDVDISVQTKFELDDYWEEEEFYAIGFMPKSEININARHTKESLLECYRIAKSLAKTVDGLIYDHQVCVIYDPLGKPLGHNRTDGAYEAFGAGVDLFMDSVATIGGWGRAKRST